MSGKINAQVWQETDTPSRSPIGRPISLWDASVPDAVRRAIIARVGAGDRNGSVGHGRLTYQWQL